MALAGCLLPGFAARLAGGVASHLSPGAAPPEAEETAAWAISLLSQLPAAPERACRHAGEEGRLPLLACAWRRSLSCPAPPCLQRLTALPGGRERHRCDRCGGQAAAPFALAAALGASLLLARACPPCLGGLATSRSLNRR